MSKIVGWIIGIIIMVWLLSTIGNIGKYDGETAEYWFEAYDEAESRAQTYQEALQEANSNIEDAKYSAWESYDEMGYALDNLETVPEP